MTLVSGQVRVAGTGELFLAPVGTILPDAASDTLDPAFKGFGYTTQNGVVLSKSVEREGISAWQSLVPLRFIYTGQEFAVEATFLQSNKDILKAWLNSGDFASDGGTPEGFRADVSVDPASQEYALVVRWTDGDITSLLVLGRSELIETGDVPLARKATEFPMKFSALAPDEGDVLASWLTTDPAFDPTPTP